MVAAVLSNLSGKTMRRRAGTNGSRTGTLAALPEPPEGIKLGCRSEPYQHRHWGWAPVRYGPWLPSVWRRYRQNAPHLSLLLCEPCCCPLLCPAAVSPTNITQEPPDLEPGHGEAQHGMSGTWHQQGPNSFALYLCQVAACPSPYLSHLPISI